MSEWAFDSSGLRAAHRNGTLTLVGPAHRLIVSPLTWLPAPSLTGPAVTPVLRYPAPGLPSGRPRRPLRDAATDDADPSPPPHPMVELCDALEELHADERLLLDETSPVNVQRIATIEAMHRFAGLRFRPTDEAIAAVITADAADLPLVCDDKSVRKLARHAGLTAFTVESFRQVLAAA